MKESFGRIRRVLVVHDELSILESLAMILFRTGFAPKMARSGEQAIEIARDFQPDLLISDVALHGISGIEAANEIRNFLPTCKVILFSGQATTVDLSRRSPTADCYEILSKPVHPDVLLQRIADLG
jgi:DNA-binding response OmpR family regulator